MDDITWPPKRPNDTKTENTTPEPPQSVESPAEESVALEAAPHDSISEPAGSRPPKKRPKLLHAPKKGFEWLKFKHSNLNTKQKIMFWALMVALVFAGSAAVYAAYKHFHQPPPKQAQQAAAKKAEPPKPTTEPSHLTGVEVAPELNKRPVTGIMIENSPDARPQSGLKDAGVVYEAIAEGGITRFLALFQEAQPNYIGPIRSVRPYYLDFLMPFDAAVAHVGGAPQALADIKTLNVKDLDQFANSGAYYRINTRYAPHNMYSDFAHLDALNQSKGYNSSNFTGFARKKDAPSATPTAKSIDINISGYLYNTHYDYDTATNSYKRSEAGKPHVDERSGAQLQPKVVVALVMSRGIASDGQHTNYATVGSGHMYVFQDGITLEGTWSKSDRKAQFTFVDANGAPIKFNAGQTWITIVDGPAAVAARP